MLNRFAYILGSTDIGLAALLIVLLLLTAIILFAVRPSKQLSIHSRLLISFVFVALLPGILIASASIILGLHASDRTMLAGLEAAANMHEARVLAWIEDLQRDITVLRELEYADLHTVLTMEHELPAFRMAHDAQQQRFRDTLALRGGFDDLFLVDPTGVVVLSSASLDELSEGVTGEEFAGVLEEGLLAPYVGWLPSSILLKAPSGGPAPALTIAVPVVGENGERLGLLVGQGGFAGIAKIQEHRTALAEDHAVYLVSGEGRVLATLNHPEDRGNSDAGAGYLDVTGSQGIQDLLIARARHAGRYLNHVGDPVLGEYRWIPDLEVGLVVEAFPVGLARTIRAGMSVNMALIAISVGLAILASINIANGMARPLRQVAEAATKAAASLDAPAFLAKDDGHSVMLVEQNDEVGRIAFAFNEVIQRLRELWGSLDEQVAQRTQDIERRSALLQTAVDVARLGASIRDMDELLPMAAARMGEQLGVYHVGIYLQDDTRRALVMRAASTGAGLVERGVRLELTPASASDGGGTVVDAALGGEPVVVPDVGQEVRYLGIPELPYTKSEISLPLQMGGEVIGVLDLQSTHLDAFAESDIACLQTLAEHLSLAIENARRFGEAEKRLLEMGRLVRMQPEEGLREVLEEGAPRSYAYDGVEVRAADSGATVAPVDLELPITVGSGSDADHLGRVRVNIGSGRGLTQADIELARSVAAEASYALERARLVGGTQRAFVEADRLYCSGRAIADAGSIDEVVSALADYIAAPEIDLILALMSRSATDGYAPFVEVASVWSGSPDRIGARSTPTLQPGDRWELTRVPILSTLAVEDPNIPDSLVIEDVSTSESLDTASRETFQGALGLRSALILPLRSGSEVIGWLLMGCVQGKYTFPFRVVRRARGLADQATSVLRGFELLELATRRVERERAISAIGDNIRRSTDIETILRTSVRELGRTLCASEGIIRLHPGGSATTENSAGMDSGSGATGSNPELNLTAEERDV